MRIFRENFSEVANVHIATAMESIRRGRGFLMTLEAASAFFLLIIAASALVQFRLPKESAQDFYACSDAAIILSKSSGLSGADLLVEMGKMRALGGPCVSFELDYQHYSNCEIRVRQENIQAFNFPVWKAGVLQNATVACWQGV